LFRQAKIRAVQKGTSLKSLVVNALERELSGSLARPAAGSSKLYRLRKDGFPILSERDGVMVTDETVNQLREQEGI